ncbi:LPXTG cell wall anchor domain-containing protein [Priestia endophytica]|uniref:LPXTG cell wall anchor domain-containing protein n=1 Tax=Priestia endophytica TaxID=135735 RepID=UPI000DCA625A|nr:LPXTG cell wall anchor domain-containing protein [Priestia endophytica]RAS77467.1 hypothetical protein A4R27_18670 [Priestia endophytica]RAS90816.1 hypothetical protein A3863_07475 [Priestia endophytica]
MVNMKKLCVGIMACGVVFGVGNVTAQAAPAEDKDCSDFANYDEVVAYWNSKGYTAQNDPERLDGWGNKVDDGIPCEAPKGYDTSKINGISKTSTDTDESAQEETKQEETTSTTPATGEKADDKEQATTTTKDENTTEMKEQGEALPKTATNDVAMMGLAGLMAAAGGALMIKRRKK